MVEIIVTILVEALEIVITLALSTYAVIFEAIVNIINIFKRKE